jgi:hypothetical protein
MMGISSSPDPAIPISSDALSVCAFGEVGHLAVKGAHDMVDTTAQLMYGV